MVALPFAIPNFTEPERHKRKRRHRKNSFKRLHAPYKSPMRRKTHTPKSAFTANSMFSRKNTEKLWGVEKRVGKAVFSRENIGKLWKAEKKLGGGFVWAGGKAFQGIKAGVGYAARKLPVGIKQKLPGKHEGIRSIAFEVKEQKGNKQSTINYGKREGRKE